jgi:hypothetical protein
VALHEQTESLFPVDGAAAMARLTADPQLRSRCAAAARASLQSRKFASDIIGRQTVALYRWLLTEEISPL